VAEMWTETLEVDITGPDDDFFDAGGHSMLVLACLAEIQDRFPEATIQDFFTHRTVGAFAAYLDGLADGAGADPETAAAASQPESHRARAAVAAVAAPAPRVSASVGSLAGRGDVLLTGAAGFLGAHLLATLLREPEGAVVCPIRPRDGVSGAARLEEAVTR